MNPKSAKPRTGSGGAPAPPHTTAIANVTLAGIIAALHVGKATIAMPQMREEFGRSLESLSWVMSAFPLIGVIGGMAAGVFVQRWGDRRLLGLGLIILAVASAVGAEARSFAWLLTTRLVEGLGFLIIVVAAPAILHRLAQPTRRNLVFGIWSTFMGSGMAISILLGPFLGGWRHVWLIDAGLTLLAALLLPLTTPAMTRPAQPPRPRDTWLGIRSTLKARSPLLLALVFGGYSLQFFAVLSFLPIFLMQRMGISVGTAGLISAAVVAVNIIGNLSAGLLLTRGVPPRRLLVAVSIATGLAGAGVFLPVIPPAIAVLLCFVFSMVAGMLPATILSCAPQVAPAPALTPLCLGLVMQGNYLGQVLGPIVISATVALAGWSAAAIPVLAAATLCVVLELPLKLGHRKPDRLKSVQQ